MGAEALDVVSRELAANLALVPIGVSVGCAVFLLRATLDSEDRGKRLPVYLPTVRVVQESAAFFVGTGLAVLCFALIFGQVRE